MSFTYKITVITICLNDCSGLVRTVESVDRNNIAGVVQHIIKDGGSTDGSLAFLETLSMRDSRKWKSQKDSGIYAAMNQGLEMADGEFVLMLNSGDTLKDGTLLRWTNYLKDHPEIDLICSNLQWNRINGTYLLLKPEMAIRNPTLMPVWHQAALIRKTFHDRFGLYRTDYKMISDMIFYHRAFPHANHMHLDFVSSEMAAGGISEMHRTRQMMEFFSYLKEVRAPLREYIRTLYKFIPKPTLRNFKF